MKPVSIIITNYNYGSYLGRCIRSCLNQFNADVEIIVIDDGSSDNSFDVIKSFGDKVKFYKTPKNLGVAGAANLGIEKSTGQFIIRVDADDYVSKDMCYMMTEYLVANKDAFCVSCDYYLVDDYEQFIERKYSEKDNISCGIMYRKDLLIKLGSYNVNMRHREEEELRKRLGDFYKIHHLRMPFYRYRMHQKNKTKTKEYEECEV